MSRTTAVMLCGALACCAGQQSEIVPPPPSSIDRLAATSKARRPESGAFLGPSPLSGSARKTAGVSSDRQAAVDREMVGVSSNTKAAVDRETAGISLGSQAMLPAKLAWHELVRMSALPWRAGMERIEKADAHLATQRAVEAIITLGDDRAPAAALVRARAWRLLESYERAAGELEWASEDRALVAHAQLERGLLAQARGDQAGAARALLPLITGDDPSMARRAALPLCEALVNSDPQAMLEHAAQIEDVLPREEVDARSLWLDAQIRAATALGRGQEALALRLRRYLEEPVSSQTPVTLPAGSIVTSEQLLARAEVLLGAHRNTRVLEALADISEHKLSAEQKCSKAFIHGLAARKLRLYAEAERNLARAVEICADEDLTRRAMYLLAKVISIHAGLRAVPIIESFVKRFAGHSMVDDVLFWAGDMYQRRKRWTAAERYYRRIEKLPHKGDYCGEARWRLAWMAYRRDRMRSAQATLQRILADDGCAPLRFDRARAHYWSARIYARLSDLEAARASYRRAIDINPLGYYAQLGLTRLAELAPQDAQQIMARLPAPQPAADVELCPGFLAEKRAFSRGVELLVRGLRSDAVDELCTIEVPEQQVLAQTHAVALGLAAEPARPVEPVSEHGQGLCTRERAILSLALLLDRAGAHREAHWRLRTDFADTLASFPTPKSHAVWLAAYPLAFREQIEVGERESGLPELFLQALSREESALDPQVVSWAGAYGLTQLLLSSGQRAGKLLEPPVLVTTAEELLEPGLNARLGATLLAASWRKLGNNLGLALAAYNAGDQVALTWWKRHQGEPFDVFSEEITIKETRGYVKRVLKTFGIYRWIYAGEPPMLPVDELPALH